MKVSDIEVSYVDHMGTDLSVVNAARVSFDKESDWLLINQEIGGVEREVAKVLKEGDRKLIGYLAKHKHYSPFNHTFITVRVKAPIFVARQLVKHEYMPWNEVSRRYVDSEPEFYIPELIHERAENVKQGSGDVNDGYTDILWQIQDHSKRCLRFYEELLAQNVCPEEARMILPHNLMTEWIWSGTLKAFHKMLSLRLDGHTQGATRVVAEKCRDIIEPLFPVSFPALMDAV